MSTLVPDENSMEDPLCNSSFGSMVSLDYVTPDTDNEDSTDPELGHEETTMFRAVAARLNYLSQDRPDITFATMKLCSKMSRPDAQDLKNMKRLGRFLVGRPRVGCLCEWQAHPSALHALADADWAGDRQSRKSVSGGMVLHGKHLIKAWTKQHSTVATSSAEAELG